MQLKNHGGVPVKSDMDFIISEKFSKDKIRFVEDAERSPAPPNRRHCERSEAIQPFLASWIASSLRFSQ
jgi:hypothetical protein